MCELVWQVPKKKMQKHTDGVIHMQNMYYMTLHVQTSEVLLAGGEVNIKMPT